MSSKTRPSPKASATLFILGFRGKGNDENIWEIVENKNGIKRWKKVSSATSKAPTSKSKTSTSIINNVEDVGNFANEKMGKKWVAYLKSAFEELLKNNIIAYLYPFNDNFTLFDYIDDENLPEAWSSTTGKLKPLINFYKKLHFETTGVKLTKKNIEKLDEGCGALHCDLSSLPHLNYEISVNPNRIEISYELSKNAEETVDNILHKHFGKNYIWSIPDRTIYIYMNKKDAMRIKKITTEKPTIIFTPWISKEKPNLSFTPWSSKQ